MIPKIINVCGIPYRVRVCKDNFSLDCHMGEITYATGEIRINQDMTEQLQTAALIHEWIHGALVMLGYQELSHDEQFVQAFSIAINQTFDIKGGGAA